MPEMPLQRDCYAKGWHGKFFVFITLHNYESKGLFLTNLDVLHLEFPNCANLLGMLLWLFSVTKDCFHTTAFHATLLALCQSVLV